ncbi:MAG: cupin domain-containing protein [Nitrospinota bacterium]|jgi:quercetin dioxygenase-like cupin family protein|nr:cupin domain-containing protein [Nitrospinota bacterium]
MRGEDEIEWLPAALHRQLVQKELLSLAEAGELNLQLWKILRERTEPGGTVLPHTHDTAEIIHFTRGEVRALLSEERTDCGPGDTLIVPAGAIHGVSNTAAGPSEQISFFIPEKGKENFGHTELEPDIEI